MKFKLNFYSNNKEDIQKIDLINQMLATHKWGSRKKIKVIFGFDYAYYCNVCEEEFSVRSSFVDKPNNFEDVKNKLIYDYLLLTCEQHKSLKIVQDIIE